LQIDESEPRFAGSALVVGAIGSDWVPVLYVKWGQWTLGKEDPHKTSIHGNWGDAATSKRFSNWQGIGVQWRNAGAELAAVLGPDSALDE
jgi:hypothetical protein